MSESIAALMQTHQRALNRMMVMQMEDMWSGGPVRRRIQSRFDRCCHGKKADRHDRP